MLSFNAGVGAWSCPDLTGQTLLTPHLSLYLLVGVDGRWAGEEVVEHEEGWEGKLRVECKMKLKIKKKFKKQLRLRQMNCVRKKFLIKIVRKQ